MANCGAKRDAVIGEEARRKALESIVALHGEGERTRAGLGVAAAAAAWTGADGDEKAFLDFCPAHYAPSGKALDALFSRFSENLEEIQGSGLRMSRRAQWASQIDSGPLIPADALFAAWDPLAHLADDFFENRLAFVIKLNFPRSSLQEKLESGPSWTRRRWAEARLADWFLNRVPAALQQERQAAQSRAEAYISSYNIHTGHLRDAGTSRDAGAPGEGQGSLPYAEDKKILMHWGMRDEIKSQYGQPEGLRRQRLLYRAMERAIDGSIPKAVIDSASFDWDPFSNEVEGGQAESEGDGRYAMMLGLFGSELACDPFSPEAPSLVSRRFDLEREIPEAEAKALLESLFEGGTYAAAAARVGSLLGRPLEAFDVWFNGFSALGPGSSAGRGEGDGLDETALDAITRKLYPGPAAFQADIPRILRCLGFGAEDSDWLAAHVEVDPSRGSGHAMPAGMRSDKVRLRTRVEAAGMNYKAYNIALHELGHNIEQTYSLHGIDEFFLAGVPNSAFTEAFAFLFQERDLEVLADRVGADKLPAGAASRGRKSALENYWITCEIAGVALVEMEAWRWLYAHPAAAPGELRAAVLGIAKEVWNRHFAAAFGFRDSLVLAAYSHMIEIPLYLPDYPIGHLISFQIGDYLSDKSLGAEMGRMCRLGRLTPSQWMREAVGGSISAEPLIAAAREELGRN